MLVILLVGEMCWITPSPISRDDSGSVFFIESNASKLFFI